MAAAAERPSTASVTINEILTDHPLPTLSITRLPNVEAMEVRNSVRNLHEVRSISQTFIVVECYLEVQMTRI